MNADFDALEAREPAVREAKLVAALPVLVAHAQRNASAFAQLLAGVDATTINSRAALATLPVVRKPDCWNASKPHAPGGDPFGGFATIGWRALGSVRRAQRVYQSPGPIYEPEGRPPTTGASPAPCTPPACAPATWCTTAFPTISRRPA